MKELPTFDVERWNDRFIVIEGNLIIWASCREVEHANIICEMLNMRAAQMQANEKARLRE